MTIRSEAAANMQLNFATMHASGIGRTHIGSTFAQPVKRRPQSKHAPRILDHLQALRDAARFFGL